MRNDDDEKSAERADARYASLDEEGDERLADDSSYRMMRLQERRSPKSDTRGSPGVAKPFKQWSM